jgi:hypothetical protein
VQAATCFGSSLPSSGSFLDPCELLEQIGGISYEYNVYVVCVPELTLRHTDPDDGKIAAETYRSLHIE